MEEERERKVVSASKMIWEMFWRSVCIGFILSFLIGIVSKILSNAINYDTNMIVVSVIIAIVGTIIGFFSQKIVIDLSFSYLTILKKDVKKILIFEIVCILFSILSTAISTKSYINRIENKLDNYSSVINYYTDEYSDEFEKLDRFVQQEKIGITIEVVILSIADIIIFFYMKKLIENNALEEQIENRKPLTIEDIENM